MSETLTQMRQNVYHGNIELPKYKLVKFTWGNVSEINRDLGIVVIKPSGVDYENSHRKIWSSQILKETY